MGRPLRLECIRCGAPASGEPIGAGCESCAARGEASNLTTVYDLEAARPELDAAADAGLAGMARYAPLLPVDADDLVSTDIGPTPLIAAPRLAAALGIERLWIKDESRGPTWSFKDRPAAIAAAHARSLGRGVMISASTGNAAAASAAHARRAGLEPVILFARSVNPLMARFGRSYGATVVSVASKEDRWRLMGEAVRELGWYPNSNYMNPPVGNNPWAIDGYKAVGFEVFAQLGDRVPDAVFFPVCYGDALYGVWKAFLELEGMGYVGGAQLPQVSGGEIQGSLEHALTAGLDSVERVEQPGETIAFSIAAAQSTYQALHATRASGGWVSAVSDPELLEAQRLLAEHEGLLVETASAAGLAGLRSQLAGGRVDPASEIVLINSSTGLKSLGVVPLDGDPDEVSELSELVAAVDRRGAQAAAGVGEGAE